MYQKLFLSGLEFSWSKMSEKKLVSEIIVDLEKKMDQMLKMISALDLNIKIISNKLNLIKTNSTSISPEKYSISPTETIENNLIKSADKMGKIPVSQTPLHTSKSNTDVVRRTNRADAIPITPPNSVETINFKDYDDAVVSPNAFIPITSKVVDSKGKGIFLAEIEILEISTKKITKIRAKGDGRWETAVPIGNYELTVSKRIPGNKEKIVSKQSFVVDGSSIPLKLKEVELK